MSRKSLPLTQPSARRWDSNSLQFRLTVGVVTAALLGLGSVTGWIGWRMRHILLQNHKETVEMVAERFKDDVDLYLQQVTLSDALQQVIDYRTAPDTALWVKGADGALLAKSETLSMGSWKSSGIANQLMQLELNETLEIRPMGDWTLIICASPLNLNGQPATLYVVDDITADQASFQQMTLNLSGVTALVVALLAIAISLYVQRALSPIRQLNRLAGTVTAETLNEHRLQLEASPTEVAELARSYNLMLERLSKAWTQQKRFVNDVSHELRTPLTLVQGYLQSTLRRCQTLTELQREGLEIANAEANRTIRLLQELLDLARIDSGHMPFNLQPADLKDVVLAAVDQANAQHNYVQPQIIHAPLIVRCDRRRLHEALLHLLDNALCYSPPERPIIVRLERRDGWAQISVQDHGCGIPLTQQQDIFEPFYRVDENRPRSTGGTGLGLTLVKATVEAMQGHVSVQSAPGSGSIFTIGLPV